MMQFILVLTLKERKMAKACCTSQMALFTKECLKEMTSRVKEYMSGRMVGVMMEIGTRIKCMAMDGSLGRMGGLMRGTINMIRSMVKAPFFGLMVGNIQENGGGANSTDKELIYLRVVIGKWENGSMGKESDGSILMSLRPMILFEILKIYI